jgi:hypothetical protein
MSTSTEENDAKGMGKKTQSVVEIPSPVGLESPEETKGKNGSLPSRSRRSVWFGKTFGPMGKYGKLKKTQFVLGAHNLEV